MAKRRNSQVGFRDDTSYLAAHYGRGNPRQPPQATTNKTPSSLCATPGCRKPIPSAESISPTTSGTHAGSIHSVATRRTPNNGAARIGRVGQTGAQKSEGTGTLVRPSLSEQLASIGKAAEDITADIRQSHGLKPLEGAMLTTPSEGFLVGKLRCKYPSPVLFFNHKCVYTFHHPFEATRITMEMFFRDMRCATLDIPRRQLRFKIDHPLCHYGRDYSHKDPSHFVAIQFSSGLDAERVTQKVMPLIRSAGRIR